MAVSTGRTLVDPMFGRSEICLAGLTVDNHRLRSPMLKRLSEAEAACGRTSMIELRHLRCFVAVAEELSFRRAAERVHVDQSPLSRTIRDLESDVGVLLFARTPRTLRLTPAGEVLLQDVRELFVRLERARRRARETDARYRAPLRVGIADGLSQPKLSRCLSNWRELAPQTPLELTDLRALDLADALRREELDLGFSFGVPHEDAIEQGPVWSYPLVAVLPAGHELTSRASLSVSEIVAFPMIACHPKYKPGKRRQVDEILLRHTSSPVYAGEAGSLTGLINMIGTGLGIGLADAGHMETLRRADVVVIPLEDDSVSLTTCVLFKRQRGPLPDALQLFLTHARSLR
jgi:DNA-binding transcriptional LysR family regulator